MWIFGGKNTAPATMKEKLPRVLIRRVLVSSLLRSSVAKPLELDHTDAFITIAWDILKVSYCLRATLLINYYHG